VIARLLDDLRGLQNPDGGWGASAGRQSTTEATAFATLALRRHAHAGPGAERGLGWLRAQQNADGSWGVSAAVPEGSWTTALAMLTLADHQTAAPEIQRGAEWLLSHRGRRLGLLASLLYRVMPGRMPVRLDPSLRGWAWTANEFSWVEPTSYALIALKTMARTRDDVGAVVREAEAMLYDRACPGGGWNYGNSTVYGEALTPFLETTAVALIALHDRREDEPVRAGYAALHRMLREARSGLALSWAILCLRLRSENVGPLRARLAETHASRGFLGETRSIALALLAGAEGPPAFAVA
jgi:squalene cyclase